MTQEDKELKELLHKDLIARSPYGVKVQYTAGDGISTIDNCNVGQISIKSECVAISDTDSNFVWRSISSCKPYLRPMLSMTEEEKKEFESLGWRVDELDDNDPWTPYAHDVFDGVVWLNKKMFDYRGLIEKGLALEAPEGMYK